MNFQRYRRFDALSLSVCIIVLGLIFNDILMKESESKEADLKKITRVTLSSEYEIRKLKPVIPFMVMPHPPIVQVIKPKKKVGNDVKPVAEKQETKELKIELKRKVKPKVPTVKVSKRSSNKERKTVQRNIINPLISDEATVREGRTQLRVLEHGEGPNIEITWPRSRMDRKDLHRVFVQCYGVVTALLDQRSRLFIAGGARGEPWPINADRYSGFVRESGGQPGSYDRSSGREIRNYHQTLISGSLVKIFPRHVDSYFLGRLSQIVGPLYSTAKSITAGYRLSGKRVFVENIKIDGQSVAGVIDLKRVTGTC